MRKLNAKSIAVAVGPLLFTLVAGLSGFGTAHATLINISNVPLFLTSPALPNVLVVLDNSNSMDEDASGAAVGSDSPQSKSEIARNVVKQIVTAYQGTMNMGLMAYQQAANTLRNLDNAPYDASYDPAHWDPDFAGARDSTTKKYRTEKKDLAGEYIYYNVALPYYYGGGAPANSAASAMYCYSTTANAFNNGEVPPTADCNNGPWDTYHCYWNQVGTSDALAEAAGGYSSHVGNYSFCPTDSDLAQGITDFGSRLATWWVGSAWFANISPGRGYLHVPIDFLDAAQATGLDTKLGTSQFTTNAPTDPAFPLQNAGLTPIEGTLLTAKDYFGGNWTTAAEGYTPSCYPLPTSCGHDYVILVTDGLPSTDKDGTAVTDTATALADAAAAAQALYNDGIETYVVGFALPYGISPDQLDVIATAGNTGSAYSASDAATLNAALQSIFIDIQRKTSSAASVALNSTSWNSGSMLFQARFNSLNWSGQLLSYPIGQNGSLGALNWDAAARLDAQDWNTGRQVLTWNPDTSGGATPHGVGFRWNNLAASQQAALNDDPDTPAVDDDGEGQARLDYLRGSAANEGAGNDYRVRGSKLGDIVFSSPYFAGEPAFGYPNNLENAAYGDFRATYFNRSAMVYIGANDGMLHGFDADTGDESMAYVPSVLYAHLSELTSTQYVHRYYVDGSPTVGDAFYGGAWHSVLVGGMNAGGQGYFALDVTDPANFSENNASTLVLWELTDADDADLGYSYSQPAIVRMANDHWVAVFGNGYNNTEADGHPSASGNAVLYIVDIGDRSIVKIDTGVGAADDPENDSRPNGLATVAPVDVDGDHTIDYIYAGDLFGNLWKFDVTAANTNQWGSAYTQGNDPVPLFTATDADGAYQPITSRPEVGIHPAGESGYMVYFGTGRYLDAGDNLTAGAQTQTFYGIWDKNEHNLTSFARSDLQPQSVTDTGNKQGFELRVVSDNSVDWESQYGWRLDLPTTGEKQVSNSILRDNKIIFTTLIPSTDPCAFGGTGWLMELDAANGGRIDEGVFDLDNDGVYSDDFLTVTVTDPDGNDTSVERAASGKRSTVGIIPTPAILPVGNKEYKYTSGSSGNIEVTTERSGGNTGRQSWQQLR